MCPEIVRMKFNVAFFEEVNHIVGLVGRLIGSHGERPRKYVNASKNGTVFARYLEAGWSDQKSVQGTYISDILHWILKS